MLWLIHCDQCNKSGMFDIEFNFILESHSCEKCSHHTSEKWNYHFCNTDCLCKWLRENEIEEKGLHCKACRNCDGKPTGWRWGFEENGVCESCKGTKRVKSHKKQQWEFIKEI